MSDPSGNGPAWPRLKITARVSSLETAARDAVSGIDTLEIRDRSSTGAFRGALCLDRHAFSQPVLIDPAGFRIDEKDADPGSRNDAALPRFAANGFGTMKAAGHRNSRNRISETRSIMPPVQTVQTQRLIQWS